MPTARHTQKLITRDRRRALRRIPHATSAVRPGRGERIGPDRGLGRKGWWRGLISKV